MAKDIKVALELDNKQFNKGIQDSTTQVGKFESTSKRSMVGVAAAVAGVTAAFAGLRRGLGVAADFQDLQSSLSTVFGGLDQGADAFQRVTDIASQTQFQVQDITKAFIQLKGAGVEPTKDIIMTFANAAAITTDQLGAFQAAISLISRTTAGGLGLEELERLGDRGIPVYDILNEKLGITRLQISEVGKTARGAEKIIAALGEGINERFGDALSNRISNTNQRISNFNDAVAVLTNNLLAGANEGFGELIANLTDSIRALNENVEGVMAFGKAIAGIGVIALGVFGGRGIMGLFNKLKPSLANIGLSFSSIGASIKSITGLGMLQAGLTAIGRQLGIIGMKAPMLNGVQRTLLGIAGVSGGLLTLAGVVGGLTLAFQAYRDVLEQRETDIVEAIVGEGREKVEQEIEQLAQRVLDLTEAMNLYYESTRFSLRDTAGLELGRRAAEIVKLEERIATLRKKLAEMPKSGGGSYGDDDDGGETTLTTLDKIAAAVDGVEQNFRSAKQFKIYIDSLMALKGELSSNEEFIEFEKAIKKIEDAFDMEVDPEVVTTRIQELREEISKVADFEDFDAVLSAINQAFRDGDINIEEYREAMEKLKGSISETEADMAIFQNAIKDIDTAIANDLTNALFEGENAIDALKNTFKEAIKQMIADTIRLMVVQTALQAIFGFFGYSATFAPSGGISNIQKKMLGGPVMKDKPYIVGEMGPELLIPSTSGNIVPNSQLGGQTTNVSYNIQAVDAPSFQALVASDPQFIHAVVSKAANDLPSGRRF